VFSPQTGRPEVLNFIAIEPVVIGAGSRNSRMGFSELEPSRLDPGKNGKRLWVGGQGGPAGFLETLPARPRPVEKLSVRIDVEPFASGARVFVIASIYSDRPAELELAVYAQDDSAPIEELSVTATMGNYERLRYLWLKDRLIDSRVLYAGFTGNAFIDLENYTLDEMLRSEDGDALVFCTPNESDPRLNEAAPPGWRYRLPRLIQYWRVAARHIEPDLRVKVNGRHVYWASRDPIPGGVAFENFEVRQRYRAGQAFVYGISKSEPWQFEPPVPRLPRAPVEETH
jgi:hypothetical protein